jgi:hypothetical protein
LSILKIHTEGRIKDIPNQVKGWEQALQGIEINKQKTLQNQPQQYQGGGPTMVPTNTPAGKQGGIDMYGNPY